MEDEDSHAMAHEHSAMADHAPEMKHEHPQEHGAMEHHPRKEGGHTEHTQHQHMVADFRKRFWVSLVITVPVLFLSPSVRSFFGFKNELLFTGDKYVVFALCTVLFFYGGWPFLKGIFGQDRHRGDKRETAAGTTGILCLKRLSALIKYVMVAD